MEKSNCFLYKGCEVVFCGFYEDKFAFYISHKGLAVFVESISELENYMATPSLEE